MARKKVHLQLRGLAHTRIDHPLALLHRELVQIFPVHDSRLECSGVCVFEDLVLYALCILCDLCFVLRAS